MRGFRLSVVRGSVLKSDLLNSDVNYSRSVILVPCVE